MSSKRHEGNEIYNGTLENKHRSGDCIYLPCIKVNSDSLPSFVARKQSEHGKGGEMLDKDEPSISYRLPRRTSIVSENVQSSTEKIPPLKKIEISIPSVKFENTEEIKLPSIGRKMDSDLNQGSLGMKATKDTGNDAKQEQDNHSRPVSNQSYARKCFVVKIPRIDFQPASPGLIVNVSRKSPERPKLTLSRTISQRKLREKEIRNLFEDVRELTNLAENILSKHLKEKGHLS